MQMIALDDLGRINAKILCQPERYAGQTPGHSAGRYRDYIQWLSEQDSSRTEAFWRQQVRDLTEPTRLVQALRSDKAQLGQGHANHFQLLDVQATGLAGWLDRLLGKLP